MPELQHYATFEESIALLRAVIEEHGLDLIPEAPVLLRPHLERYDRVTPEAVSQLRQFPVGQLEGPFTEHPLQFDRRATGTAAGTYFVEITSGPRLRWVFPGVVQDGDRHVVTPGTISYLDSYRNPDTNEWEAAPEALAQSFRAVATTLKRHMVRASIHRAATWIAKGTKQQLDRGALCIGR